MSATEGKKEEQLSFGEIMSKASNSALRGGLAGACAMGANVACLMWLRTTVNYQYRTGKSFPVAIRTLYADGGIPRFYRGVLPALIQGPLSRFGDTAANTGMLTLMNSLESTKDLNVGLKTVSASAAAALFRIFLMPIDTCKTTMQVTGSFQPVINKVKTLVSRAKADEQTSVSASEENIAIYEKALKEVLKWDRAHPEDKVVLARFQHKNGISESQHAACLIRAAGWTPEEYEHGAPASATGDGSKSRAAKALMDDL